MNKQNEFEFSIPIIRPMARKTDPSTSAESGDVIVPHLGRIQAAVMVAFRTHGDMTARTLERLPEFADYGFSTIRKRCSELAHEGSLVERGVDRSGRAPATIYGVEKT